MNHTEHHPKIIDINEIDKTFLTKKQVDKFAQPDTITAEVNIAKRTTKLVWNSDAPLLTDVVLLEKGDPTTHVELNFGDGENLEIDVLNGIPFHVEAAQLRLVAEYTDKDLTDDAVIDELTKAEAKLLIQNLIVFPKFTYDKRKRKGMIQLDDYPEELLVALSQACDAVNNPEADDVYQVHIKSEIPKEVDNRIMACFRRFKKATMLINTQPAQLTPKQAKQVERLRHALREIVLEDMITLPNLFTNDSKKENISDGFPIAALSESIQQSLFSAFSIAHKLPNIL